MNAERLRFDDVQLNEILDSLTKVRACVLGDFCADMYWLADMRLSSLSRETPHHPLPIVEERASPGAAGNVAANLAALSGASPELCGVIGRDWRGDILRDALTAANVDPSGLIGAEERITSAYIKPYRRGHASASYEDPRLDFENPRRLSAAREAELIDSLNDISGRVDVICVCDQFINGCVTPDVRSALTDIARTGVKILVDSRENILDYSGVIVKPNDLEAGLALDYFGALSTVDEAAEAALEFARKNGAPAIITMGDMGCVASDGGEVRHIPARPVHPPLDICGAGDTFMSALALSLGAGYSIFEAARLANLASSVTVKKLGITGCATAREIIEANAET